MLILTRRTDQFIRIGDDIVVTICAIDRRGSIRVGIEAPKHIPILRGELEKQASTEPTQTKHEE